MLALADSSISLTISVISALIAIATALWAGVMESRRQKREHEFLREQKDLDRRMEAERVLRRYRAPLVFAADQLLSRIENISSNGFLAKYGESRRSYVVESTTYAVAELLGWMESLRRSQQELDLGEEEATRQLNQRVAAIGRTLSTDEIAGPQGSPAGFMIWRQEQRAIGELMIFHDDAGEHTLGYASFVNLLRSDPKFAHWFERLQADASTSINEPGSVLSRLGRLAAALRDLIDHLDPNRIRALRRP